MQREERQKKETWISGGSGKDDATVSRADPGFQKMDRVFVFLTGILFLLFREKILLWTSRVGSDAWIDQLEGCSPESCLSWLRSHEGRPKHDVFTLEYSKCSKL